MKLLRTEYIKRNNLEKRVEKSAVHTDARSEQNYTILQNNQKVSS